MSILDFTGSALSKALDYSLRSGKTVIRDVLRNRFFHTFVRSVIKLALIYAAIFVVIFSPFGEWKSELVASVVFIGVTLWSLVNIIVTMINSGALIIWIFREHNIYDGIIQFVEDKWLGARIGIKLYDVLRNGRGEFAEHFNHLPSSGDVVRDYVSYVVKEVLLFGLIFGLYLLIMHCGVKTLLLNKYTDLSTFQIYAFPFVQLINFIKEK